jgi:hypothetical protein
MEPSFTVVKKVVMKKAYTIIEILKSQYHKNISVQLESLNTEACMIETQRILTMNVIIR